MTNLEIGCIVLNWNGGDRIVRCIQSLAVSKGVHTRIIVVDNGSSDGSLERIERIFPDVHCIGLPENVGLARARNEGIRWVLERSIRFVLFMDDDAHIETDCLVKLVAGLEDNQGAGIATPRILNSRNDERIWYDGGVTGILGNTVHRNMGKEKKEIADFTPLEIEFATGCCMLTKREVFETIGLLDENYFVYSEDADFSFRARKRGLRIIHIPAAEAWHDQSGDTKANRGKWFRDYYEVRNKLMLFSKHYEGLRQMVALAWYWVSGIGCGIVYLGLTGQFRRCMARLAGSADFLRGCFGKRYS